jgi:hypothetical protein
MKDLILLVADKNAQFALRGALNRPKALGIRPITFDSDVHSGRDGGARKTGPELLALRRHQFRRALLALDFEGSGTECTDAVALEAQLDHRLRSAWGERAKAIVIEPELDAWVWGSDNVVAGVIEWPAGTGIRDWLRQEGFDFMSHDKPRRPKEAFEALLAKLKMPRSSALYEEIAASISLRNCHDPAFIRLREVLRGWFPEQRHPLSPRST